jgi:hypothetical protein
MGVIADFASLPRDVWPVVLPSVQAAGIAVDGGTRDESFTFAPLERLPLNLPGVLWTACCGWCLFGLAIAPAMACVFGIQGAANNFEMVLVFASCCRPLLVLIMVLRRWRALVRSASPEEPGAWP